jgi:hypothetical protein
MPLAASRCSTGKWLLFIPLAYIELLRSLAIANAKATQEQRSISRELVNRLGVKDDPSVSSSMVSSYSCKMGSWAASRREASSSLPSASMQTFRSRSIPARSELFTTPFQTHLQVLIVRMGWLVSCPSDMLSETDVLVRRKQISLSFSEHFWTEQCS